MVRDQGGLDALRLLAASDKVDERVARCASDTMRVCAEWQREVDEGRIVVADGEWS